MRGGKNVPPLENGSKNYLISIPILIINASIGTLQSGIEDKILACKALGYAFESRSSRFYFYSPEIFFRRAYVCPPMRQRCRHLMHKLVNFQFYVKRIFDILPIFCASSSLSKNRFLWYFF